MLREEFIELKGTNKADCRLDLAVIVPTLNERESLPELVEGLKKTLQGLNWELIIVDDDSPDGTAEVVRELALNDQRIRLIHRIGRRGLSSACIDGMMATDSACIAVMDADLQHDESLLPIMMKRLHFEDLDLVVATRNADGGSMGTLTASRVLLSRFGQRIGHAIVRCQLTDPMSGFFMLRRELFVEVARGLRGKGVKILLDIITSSRRPLKIGEAGYRFRPRQYGTSKLNVIVGLEFLAMILSKRIDGLHLTRLLGLVSSVDASPENS